MTYALPVESVESSGERQCVFCLAAPCTREHVLARKWRDRYPDTPRSVQAWGRGMDRRLNIDPAFPVDVRQVDGQGPFDQTVKVVCEGCNSGWMSKLEDDVEPTLMDLHRSVRRRYRQDEVAAIVRWMVKTTIIVGQRRSQQHLLDYDQSKALREGRVPPGALVAAYRFASGSRSVAVRTSGYVQRATTRSRWALNTYSVGLVVFHESMLQCVLAPDPAAWRPVEPSLKRHLGGHSLDPSREQRLPLPGPSIPTPVAATALHETIGTVMAATFSDQSGASTSSS